MVNSDCTTCIGMVVEESTKQRDASEVIVTKDLMIPTEEELGELQHHYFTWLCDMFHTPVANVNPGLSCVPVLL